MVERTNIAARVFVDLLSVVLAGLTSAALNWSNIQPYQRGFNCDDESLRYPYRSDTVTTGMLFAISALIPAAAICTLEAITIFGCLKHRHQLKRYRFFCVPIHPYVYNVGWFYLAFAFGALTNQGITDIGKFSVGRLRPHFVSACQPDVDVGSCTLGQYQYLTNFTCLQTDAYKRRNARLSFPSGHSSLAAYAMLYAACYIQARFPKWNNSFLLKHFLQFVCIALAWACGMSRISDYKHHWSDVLVGFLIGATIASLVAVYVTNLFKEPSAASAEECPQDGPQAVVVVAKPPESRLGSTEHLQLANDRHDARTF